MASWYGGSHGRAAIMKMKEPLTFRGFSSAEQFKVDGLESWTNCFAKWGFGGAGGTVVNGGTSNAEGRESWKETSSCATAKYPKKDTRKQKKRGLRAPAGYDSLMLGNAKINLRIREMRGKGEE